MATHTIAKSRPIPRWPGIGFGTLAVASAVWFCFALAKFSVVAPDQFLVFLLGLIGLGVGIAWLILMAVATPFIRGNRPSLVLLLIALITPLSGLAGLVLLATDWDLRLRLKVSEPALSREAERVRALPGGWDPQERRVGLFHIKSSSTTETGVVRFVTDWPWMFDEAGLYHDPDRTIAASRAWPEHRTRLTGPWAKFHLHD